MCMGVIVGGGDAMLIGRVEMLMGRPDDMLIGRGREGDCSEPWRWCAAKVLLRCGLIPILLCRGVGDSGGKEEYESILINVLDVLCGTRQWNAMWVQEGVVRAMCMHLYDTVETGKHADKQSKDVRTRTGLVGQLQGSEAAGGTREGNDVARGNAGCAGKGWRIAS
jgi:hypothetical protein